MPKTVSEAIDWWLREEVRESNAGRNRILDNSVIDEFAKTRRAFMSDGSTNNMDSAKSRGHYDRFRLLFSIVDEGTLGNNDRLVGKIIHHSLMFVSGGFRSQCFLQAADAAEYAHLRFARNQETNGAAGVNIEGIVAGIDRDQLLGSRKQTVATIIATSGRINELIYKAHGDIYDWFAANPTRVLDRLGDDEPPVQAALRCQEAGITLAASHMLVAAWLRTDGLAAVPILEPKSISDAARDPIYPLAPDFVY